METFAQALSSASSFLWGWPMLILLPATHLFLTLRLKFMQRYLWQGIKLSFSRRAQGQGEISHFGALMTALAATVGTGNIVGVATAVAAGGPGAVFWMWLSGIFGIATKYSEALLAIKYRVQRENGSFAGGPMYVLARGLGWPWLGTLFAVFTAIAAFGIGNMVQANALSRLTYQSTGLAPWITGLGLTVLTALVMLGGLKSISKVCEALVPFMIIFYVLGCLLLLALQIENLPHTISLILNGAFSGTAAVGAFLGAGLKEALRFGVARGLFSNESGLGSAPIVAAAAQTKDPVSQALVSATGTFWDTVVVCLLTGLVLVNSGLWQQGLGGDALTQAAFSALPVGGPLILNVALFCFVYSTILGWCYYGEKAVEYLFGSKSVWPYRYVWVAAVLAGSTLQMKTVWDFADMANALMALPNLIALLLLSRVLVQETKEHLWKT